MPLQCAPAPLGRVWIGEVADTTRAPFSSQRWVDRLESVPHSSVNLHPRLIGSPSLNQYGDPVVIARTGLADIEPETIDFLAVLTGHYFRARVVPYVPWRMRLKGRRLLGDKFLGPSTPDAREAFVDGLSKYLRSGKAEYVLLEDVEVGSPLREHLSRVEGHREFVVVHLQRPQPHWWIRFPECPDDYWKHFSAKTRYTLRKKTKRLEHTLFCCREEKDVAPFLEQAHQVSRLTWQSKRLGLRIANNAEQRRFWESIASLGAMRSYVLQQQGRPLAFVLGTQWNGFYSYEEVGYDPSFSDSSPGTVLLVRLLEDLLERDTPGLLDFSSGDGEHKRLFGNHQTESGPLLLVRRSCRPRAILALDALNRRAESAARSALDRLRLRGLIRRLWRRI